MIQDQISFPYRLFSSSPYSFLFLPNVYPTSEKSNIITSIGWTSRREKSLINYLNNLTKNAPQRMIRNRAIRFDSLQFLFLSHVNPVAIRPRGSHSSYSFLPPSFDSSKTRTTSIDLVTSVPAIMRGIVREPVHSRSWCKRYLLVHCRRIAVATFSKCLGTETACNMSGTLRAGAVGE